MLEMSKGARLETLDAQVERLVLEYAQKAPPKLPLNPLLSLQSDLAIESLSLVSLAVRLGDELGVDVSALNLEIRSEERRVGKSVDLGGTGVQTCALPIFSLQSDLAIESLSLVSLAVRLGDELGVDVSALNLEIGNLRTVGDLVVVARQLSQSNRASNIQQEK